MKRFTIDGDGVGAYIVAEGQPVVSIDMEKVFGYNKMGELAQKALAFAVGHIFRNATAGKMENVSSAIKAVKERAEALSLGKWAAHREAGEAGESRESLISRALAAVMDVESKEAAEFIGDEIRVALEEKGIDPDAETDDLSEEQKSLRRKVAAAVRKGIADDPKVAIEVAKLKLIDAQAKASAATKAAEGKASRF